MKTLMKEMMTDSEADRALEKNKIFASGVRNVCKEEKRPNFYRIYKEVKPGISGIRCF